MLWSDSNRVLESLRGLPQFERSCCWTAQRQSGRRERCQLRPSRALWNAWPNWPEAMKMPYPRPNCRSASCRCVAGTSGCGSASQYRVVFHRLLLAALTVPLGPRPRSTPRGPSDGIRRLFARPLGRCRYWPPVAAATRAPSADDPGTGATGDAAPRRRSRAEETGVKPKRTILPPPTTAADHPKSDAECHRSRAGSKPKPKPPKPQPPKPKPRLRTRRCRSRSLP